MLAPIFRSGKPIPASTGAELKSSLTLFGKLVVLSAWSAPRLASYLKVTAQTITLFFHLDMTASAQLLSSLDVWTLRYWHNIRGGQCLSITEGKKWRSWVCFKSVIPCPQPESPSRSGTPPGGDFDHPVLLNINKNRWSKQCERPSGPSQRVVSDNRAYSWGWGLTWWEWKRSVIPNQCYMMQIPPKAPQSHFSSVWLLFTSRTPHQRFLFSAPLQESMYCTSAGLHLTPKERGEISADSREGQTVGQ